MARNTKTAKGQAGAGSLAITRDECQNPSLGRSDPSSSRLSVESESSSSDQASDSTVSAPYIHAVRSQAGRRKSAAQRAAEKRHTGDGVKPRKKRGAFDVMERIETGKTRNWGACLRCHNQRVRCIPNPSSPTDPSQPCMTCINVDINTRKAVHHLPCLRSKLQSVVMHRSGGVEITQRFNFTQMVDIIDYPDTELRVIYLTEGICAKPLELVVRRFVPAKGDKLSRICTVDGVRVEYPLAPYCLNNIEKTAEYFNTYLKENALEGLIGASRHSSELIRQTYHMIVKHYQSLPDEVEVGKLGNMKPNKSKKALWDAIYLRFALQHTVGSSWICGGDTRGMAPIYPAYDHLNGKISTPRMIVAQFESIYHERVLKTLVPGALKALEKLFYDNNPQDWFTIYSITFMLLHHVPVASADRRRYAKQHNFTETRYGPRGHPLTSYVEEIQNGTTHLLAHWHYYKCSVDLLDFNWQKQKETPLKKLTEEQTNWIKASADILRQSYGKDGYQSQGDCCWEDELYFISKMYDVTWKPFDTFSTAKASV